MAKPVSLFKKPLIESEKSTNNNDNKSSKQLQKGKQSKQQTQSSVKNNLDTKKVDKPKISKSTEKTKTKQLNTNSNTSISIKNTKTQTKKSTNILTNSNKINSSIQPTTVNWIKTTKRLPDELRPIEFNTQHKKPVFGYRLQNKSYIVDTPYFIDKFKQQFGYIEWHYISHCSDLSKCPNKFPNCLSCKIYKLKGK